MSSNEDIDRAEQLGALRSDVRHIQSDVTEIKTDIRGLSARIDRTDAKLDAVRGDLSGRIDTLRDELSARIDASNAKTDALREDLSTKIDAIKESIASAKLWAMLLYVGLAGGIFYAMARGFKWI